MKKILYKLFFINCSLLTINCYSQPTQQWARLYDGTDHLLDFPGAMVTDTVGNIYVVGSTQHTSVGNQNFVTLKYSPSGNLLWSVEYDGPGSNSIDLGIAIAIDKAGNIYVTGQSEETGFLTDAYATIKYNNNGVQQWVQRYKGSANGMDDVQAIALDDSANVYITGQSMNPSGHFDYATIKYNTNGIQRWVQRYNNASDGNDYCKSICTDSQGNVYITGRSSTIKYNTNGIPQWISRLDSLNSRGGTKVKLDHFGNVYVAGQAGTGSNADYFTAKYNNNGTVLWTAQYNGTGNNDDYAEDIAIDQVGNVYITGLSGRAGSGSDYATIKYNQNGIQQWIQRYDAPGSSYAYSIALDSQSNVYVTGRSIGNNGTDCTTLIYNTNGVQRYELRYDNSSQNDAGGSQIYVDKLYNIYVLGFKYDVVTNGDILLIKYSQLVKVKPISKNTPNEYKLFQNYPNPFNPSTKIKFSVPKRSYVELRIYDILGRLKELPLSEYINPSEYELTLDGTAYSSGTYFYQLIADGKIVETRKMIFIK